MSSKARKRFNRQKLRYSAEGIRQIAATIPSESPVAENILEVHRTGDQVQRIEFNFGAILGQYGAQLHGVDFAPDRVILHCTPGSQEAYVLANHEVVKNLVDTGLIPAQESTSPETPPLNVSSAEDRTVAEAE